MATKTLLTLEQFHALPESESGETYELDRGELITMPPPPWKHEATKNRIARILMRFLDRHKLGEAHTESGFAVDGESWRRPDVSFLRAERLEGIDEDKPFAGSPDLAVEVVSPANPRRQLARKVQHMLQSGTQVVWVVYTDTKEVNVVTNSSDQWLGPEDTIEEPTLLPGFSALVQTFFE